MHYKINEANIFIAYSWLQLMRINAMQTILPQTIHCGLTCIRDFVTIRNCRV